MYRALGALFTVPILVLLLVGIIDAALAATPPAIATAMPAGVTIAPAPAPPMPCCRGSGGPYEAVAETTQDASDGARWRVWRDPRLERRLTPESRRPLNTITIRF
jgi:hypothetical protein